MPVSHRTVTTVASGGSSSATCRAATTLAPEEMPTSSDSRFARASVMSKASRSSTVRTRSMISRLRIGGTKPAPMPSMAWGPPLPPESTAEAAGSTATISIPSMASLSTWPAPVIVPPVPTPVTKASILPPVASRISGPVVRRWTSGLAGFSNCRSSRQFGLRSMISAARRTAPPMSSSPGVSTTSAP